MSIRTETKRADRSQNAERWFKRMVVSLLSTCACTVVLEIGLAVGMNQVVGTILMSLFFIGLATTIFSFFAILANQ